MVKTLFSCILLLLVTTRLFSQEVLNGTLLRADKYYIKKDYEMALMYYLKYLEKYPRDYYAERQTALCFNRLNKPDDAIDHWPIVVESSEATEKDYWEYGKSLLLNNRGPEAKKIFMVLARSSNKSLAAWAKMYANPVSLYIDSASARVWEVNGVNSELPESNPFIFREKLFYVTDLRRSMRLFNAANNAPTQRISGALKKDSLHFFPSVIYDRLHEMGISGQYCFSPDGFTLYFSKPISNKELKIKSKEPFYKYQLYSLTMSTINNIQPEIKRFKYNVPGSDFLHPWISADGKRLFFVSDMKGSLGGKDIFMCELVNGNWSTPVNLGPEVNTNGNEVFPSTDAEGLLYFASDMRPGLGGLDIFSAAPSNQKGSLYTEAENLGVPVNSRFDDFGIYVFKQGKRAYFSSNRKNNSDDDLYYLIRK